MKIENSHDKFFKETFSNKEEAVELLKGALPKELSERIDFNTLNLDNNSYIDEDLKEHFADLVFDTVYNGKTKIKISILIEHKSYVPKYPHIQLLKYLLKIWETNIKQKKKLTPVIPLIVYHGKNSWKVKSFVDYFKGIDNYLKAFIPAFDYLLLDLSKYSDEEIKKLFKAITVHLSLLLMKKIFDDKKIFSSFVELFSGIDKVTSNERGEKFMISVFYYIFSNTDIEPDNIIKEIKQISDKGGEIAMTTAVRLRQQGMQQGLKKSIVRFYSTGKFTVQEIAKILGVSVSFVRETLKGEKN